MKVYLKNGKLDSIFMIYDKEEEIYINNIYAKRGPAKTSLLHLGKEMLKSEYSYGKDVALKAYIEADKRYEIHEMELVRKIK